MVALESVLSQEIVQRLGWTLLHFVWQATAIGLLLAILLTALRKSSANLRYIIACLALGLIVLLPVVTMQLVPVSTPRSPAGVEPVPEPVILPTVQIRELPAAEVPIVERPVKLEDTGTAPAVPWKQRTAELLEPALPYVVSCWLLGVFGLSLWHLGGWAQLQRLRRKMVKPVDTSLHTKLKQLAERLVVRCAVQLTESALVQIPTVVGWLRPVILLPASALTGLNTEQLDAILAHELAHIKRYDYLVNMLQTVVETLGFYHPAVWWISHKIRAEREHCCDDLAVSISGDRIGYARALTSMAEIRAGSSELAVAATGGNLFRRIYRLLDKDSSESSRASWIPSVITILLIAVIAIPTSLALTGQSKDKSETDIETLLINGFRENRDKFKCGVLTWTRTTINDGFGSFTIEKYQTKGSFQLWWDGKKIATKYVDERLHTGPRGSRIEAEAGGNAYDGGLLSRKPKFRLYENWFEEIIRWTGPLPLDKDLAEMKKLKNVSLDLSIVEVEGDKQIKLSINSTRKGASGTRIEHFDLSRGCNLVLREFYNAQDRLYSQETRKLQKVSGGGWFPVEVEMKSFNDEGKVELHQRFVLDMERCSFNDPSIIPEGIFEFSTIKEQKQLDEILKKFADGTADNTSANDVQSVRETMENYIAAALAGDDDKAIEYAYPDTPVVAQTDDTREALQGQDIRILRVCIGEWNAMVISSAILGDHGRIGPIVFHLKKVIQYQETHWLIDDIDLETLDTIEREINRFLERNPEAKTIIINPDTYGNKQNDATIEEVTAGSGARMFASSTMGPVGRRALLFDGVDDCLHVPVSPTLEMKPPFTIEMWIKPDFSEFQKMNSETTTSGKKVLHALWLMRKNKKTADPERPHGGGLVMFVRPPSRPEDSCYGSLYLGTADGRLFQEDMFVGKRSETEQQGWIHVSMSCRRSEKYVSVTDQPLIIGDPFFKGQIAEIRIWNKLLSDADTRQYGQTSLTGSEPNLVACWDFEHTEGQMVYDISPNVNHAYMGTSMGADNADPIWISPDAPVEIDKSAEGHQEETSSADSVSVAPATAESRTAPGQEKKAIQVDCLMLEFYTSMKLDRETIIAAENLMGGKVVLRGKTPRESGPTVEEWIRKAPGTTVLGDKRSMTMTADGQPTRKMVDLLASRGAVKILMNSTMEIMDGGKGRTESRQKVPMGKATTPSTQSDHYVEVIDHIEIIPEVLDDGNILIRTEGAISRKLTPPGREQNPILTKSTFSNQVVVSPGMSLIMGGTQETYGEVEVPEKPSTEVLFIFTPTIVKTDGDQTDVQTENAKDSRVTQSEFKINLATGVTVELIGLCEYPSAGKKWWRPDGSPLDNPPYDGSNLNILSGGKTDAIPIEFAFRLSGNLGEPAWEAQVKGYDQAFVWWTGRRSKDGEFLTDIKSIGTFVESDRRTINLRLCFIIADGPSEWVEFKNISVKPDFETDTPVKGAISEATAPKQTTISGRCLDPNGRPVSNTQVLVFCQDYRQNSLRQVAHGRTNSEGLFTLGPITPLTEEDTGRKRYLVFVPANGHGPAWKDIYSYQQITELLELTTYDSAEVAGTVVTEDFEPVAAAQVWVRVIIPPEANEDPESRGNDFHTIAPLPGWSSTTNSNGLFRIAGIPDGARIQLLVSHRDFARSIVFVKPGADVEIEVLPAAAITGRVLYGKTGKPAAGVKVQAQAVERISIPGGMIMSWAETTTDSQGRYKLESLHGVKHNVWARADNLTVVALDSFEAKRGQTHQAPDLLLVEGGFITGRVIDQETGEPVKPGAASDVAIYGPSRPRSGAAVESSHIREDGSFRIRVAPGRNYIYLRGMDDWGRRKAIVSPPHHWVEVSNGQTVEVEFKIRKLSLDEIKEAEKRGPRLVITTPKTLDEVKQTAHVEFAKPERLREMGIPILIETRILTATDDFLKGIGLDANSVRTSEIWSEHLLADSAAEPNSQPYRLILDDLSASFLLKAIAASMSAGKGAEVLAAPQVIAMAGKQATLKIVTEELPVPSSSDPNGPSGNTESKPQFIEVGTSIRLTPDALLDTNNVRLDFEWELRQIQDFKKQKSPLFAMDNIKTTAVVPDGKTLLIGGKKFTEYRRVGWRVPVLGDMPGIGGAFRGINVTEGEQKTLLILVKPTINPQKPTVSPPKPRSVDPDDPLVKKLEKKFERSANKR